MASETQNQKFGTLPVFLTSICTILGAILFLRFGWAVGQVGLLGTLAIILIGHLVTLPTSLAIAEIATNQRVEGGGAYYIISRSFGLNIGGAIGIALYLSQAISVAFYVIAFAQSTAPLFEWLDVWTLKQFGWTINHWDYRMVSLPTMGLLSLLVLTRGANSGMNLLYIVAGVLFVSLLMFFAGTPETPMEFAGVADLFLNKFHPEDFSVGELATMGLSAEKPEYFYVFTIIFPAFTGIIAGLGLSGDLKDPGKSIPTGTIAATLVGMFVYVLVAFKLAFSLPPEVLANKDRLVMSEIAIWAPIIPIGLAAAAISSALGSVLVAPRTLQALGGDKIFPTARINSWIASTRKRDSEPINGGILTVLIAFVFVFIGDVDFVAEIISMFFMVTYGAICLISFLEHFSSNPAYRPSFTSRWYFSLAGAIFCIWLMFKMNLEYAVGSVILMALIYVWVSRYNDNNGMTRIFKGVIFQISRGLRVMLQKAAEEEDYEEHWVPSVICISQHSFERLAAFDMVRFISQRYGFGTYIHMIRDFYSKDTVAQSRDVQKRLLQRTRVSRSKVYVDTMISPSYTSAVAQVLQIPGISGQDNNMILFEYFRHDTTRLPDMVDNIGLIKAADFDALILQSSEKGFGYKHEIHIWLTSEDFVNGNLMILLAYIILGHSEWKGGEIKIFAVYPEKDVKQQKDKLLRLIAEGRMAISPNNIEVIAHPENQSIKSIITDRSVDADLTLIGFGDEDLANRYDEVFSGYDDLGNVLFVNTDREKAID
ncbi:amino acid permease [Pontibacter sp. G13]|uniref:amino acid permease n=1 Tax=Pontibacter sp. G13 TaxID=3074898 RepID=UPI00288996CB|nr:amino acid permease [Pontibacter sp. G13]WNJ18521.1 amino acid permease [Pontibacter sp. G13]